MKAQVAKDMGHGRRRSERTQRRGEKVRKKEDAVKGVLKIRGTIRILKQFYRSNKLTRWEINNEGGISSVSLPET